MWLQQVLENVCFFFDFGDKRARVEPCRVRLL